MDGGGCGVVGVMGWGGALGCFGEGSAPPTPPLAERGCLWVAEQSVSPTQPGSCQLGPSARLFYKEPGSANGQTPKTPPVCPVGCCGPRRPDRQLLVVPGPREAGGLFTERQPGARAKLIRGWESFIPGFVLQHFSSCHSLAGL